jgi:hypothetical protein
MSPASLTIEPSSEETSTCDCCSRASRQVTGFVHEGDAALAAYVIHWTPGSP